MPEIKDEDKTKEELINDLTELREHVLALEEAIGINSRTDCPANRLPEAALNGLMRICSSCKKIRDEQGAWENIESYIEKRSMAAFSHGICPECARKLYPEYKEAIDDRKKAREKN